MVEPAKSTAPAPQPVRPAEARLIESRATLSLRWRIAGLLALATALSYLDRQSFPVVVGEIQRNIPITTEQYGDLTSLFLLAYALMYVGGGRLLDWLGTRTGYAVMLLCWSAADFLTGAVTSVAGLATCRVLLGIGEGGGFSGSAKAVAEWFAPKERSLAFGIFNVGSSIGAVIAAPLTALIVAALSWRWVFFITGGMGLLWVWSWLKQYPAPRRPLFIPQARRIPWRRLMAMREMRGLLVARFLADGAGYFLIFWLPKYLADVRGLKIHELGYLAWIPYAVAGVGSLSGGALGSYLIGRKLSVDRSRKIALGLSAALMPAAMWIAASSLGIAIALFSITLFAHQFFSTNIQTLPADLFPSEVVGSIAGLLGGVGSFGGMLLSHWVGAWVGGHGYPAVFVIAGVLHPLAFGTIVTAVRRIEPLHIEGVCQ